MRWGADNGSFLGLKVALIKGVQSLDVLQEDVTKHKYSGFSSTDGDGGAEYLVKEDNYYYIGVVNLNPQSVMVSMNVDISSKTYDTSKAITNCSMASGLCEFDLPFPRATYVVLTIPSGFNNYFGGSLTETNTTAMTTPPPPPPSPTTTTIDTVAAEETSPLLGEKSPPRTYGTIEDPESGLRENSSEDLLDGKMCVICYDERRNSFFIPCGHCATCYACAQRLLSSSLLLNKARLQVRMRVRGSESKQNKTAGVALPQVRGDSAIVDR
ncbi:hypothetical protein QJS04_geneDACA001658 [Acorus gramineus]|uniref:E3 ubiquitin-protein ligase APD1-4 middle domain-containing protein n=1 Tax=Acorus gramineus TaxID=55184 RepID=A0AAV9BHS3_ACOGR|nr:hypothetical protein QJS04_geneDACA001658 [Acorus gramineus]